MLLFGHNVVKHVLLNVSLVVMFPWMKQVWSITLCAFYVSVCLPSLRVIYFELPRTGVVPFKGNVETLCRLMYVTL